MPTSPAELPIVTDGKRQRAPHVPQRFRTDIQALRAIAVLLVLVYHLRPERLTGGYIGVDVFFVISGFLITSHLVREASRSGRVKLGAFWAARARRILPASLVAIAVTVGLTAVFSPVTSLENLQRQALASIFYVQNWVLASDSVDYSAAENDATAFQHFWSLSVEEQFYVFWPLIVFAALWIVARRSTGERGAATDELRLRRLLTTMFGVVVLASFVFSTVAVLDGRADAYFITTTRVWELGAGGLLAVITLRRITEVWRHVLAYGGLAAIAVSAVVLTNETPFPGVTALPVILGTIAVILAGTPGRDEGPVTLRAYDPWLFVSRLRVTQWIGDRSYSLYLWHFPVIVLWPVIADRKVGYIDLFAMTVVSFVLAHFSYRWIEQPVRRATFFSSSTPRTLIAALIAMVVVAGMTFAYPATSSATAREWDALATQAQSLPALGAAAVTGDEIPTFTTPGAAVTPSPLRAGDDRNIAFSDEECVSDQRAATTVSCTAGPADADQSVVLVGDSHARVYSTALADMAESDGWSLRTYLHNACPFSTTPRVEEERNESVCTAPNAVVMDEILAQRPDLVITTWSAAAQFVDDGSAGEPGAVGLAEYWNQLEEAGIQVLVLRDVPRMARNIPDCVALRYDSPDSCGVSRDRGLRGEEVTAEAIALAPEATLADFTDTFCTEERCKAVIGNVVVYSDNHHLTDTFARTMIPQLSEEMDRALASG
ncbi:MULTISPECIES: acyltransferase family protein [unclassified Microbacterium]|uniref:acyltransferase family protein n=1 Tax=unclassified Microbacterium TaxID=2609290 RepID=UPI003864300A